MLGKKEEKALKEVKKQKEEIKELKQEVRHLEKITKIRDGASKFITRFRQETKRSIVTAITAAFGFLIALAWKDVIVNFVNNLTLRFGIEKTSLLPQTYAAAIITLICVVGIMLTSRWAGKTA